MLPGNKRGQPAGREVKRDFIDKLIQSFINTTKQKKVNYMSKKSVFCIATSRNQADQIVDRLKTASFSNNGISALFLDKGTTHDFVHEKNTKAPEGAVAGAGTGGVIGGALGWIAGIGALAIPGIGPFIAAGPIVAALSGAAVGAAVGGIAGGLIGLGIPEIEARRYEDKVKAGSILISVHTEDAGDIARARDIFDQAGTTDIYTTGEAFPPRNNRAVERGPGSFEFSAA
jgi:hypothetical protein